MDFKHTLTVDTMLATIILKKFYIKVSNKAANQSLTLAVLNQNLNEDTQ